MLEYVFYELNCLCSDEWLQLVVQVAEGAVYRMLT